MKKTLIFDLDGTLVDAKELHHASFEWAIQQQKSDFVLTNAIKHELEGIPTLNKVELLNKKGYGLDIQQAYEQKQEHTEQHLDMLSWDKYLPNKLQQLSKRYNLALASNARSRFVYQIMSLMDLTNFNVVITADFVPLPLRKPNPYMFVEAMRILQSWPHDTVIFEDSEAGIQAANNAGVSKVEIVENSTHTSYLLDSYINNEN